MLLKFWVIVLIIFLNKKSCFRNADEIAKVEKDADLTKNKSMPFKFNLKLKKLVLNPGLNATTNRVKVKGTKNSYLDEYFALTCDGHVLSLFRLTYDETKTQADKCPVLLVHGLFQSSDRFLEHDKKQSLALNLQELGHDVWFANMRGNKYNREHVFLAPEMKEVDKLKYLNYTYEILGTDDIPTTIDFILKVTSFDKLIYIGHGLGGTAFLTLNSLKPEYNRKIANAYLFAPLGYHHYFPNAELKAGAKEIDDVYKSLLKEGTTEIFPYKTDDAKFSPAECLGSKTYSNTCELLNIKKIMGLNDSNNNVKETRGGSIGPLIHLAQNVRSGTFSRWDFGETENLKLYQTSTPPNYDLSRVTAPTTIIYAPNDELVSPIDIAILASYLANVKRREVKSSSFKHDDFLVGSDAMENVYADIIDELKKKKIVCMKQRSGNGLFFHLLQYKWIFGSILLIILLIMIALCLSLCKNSEDK